MIEMIVGDEEHVSVEQIDIDIKVAGEERNEARVEVKRAKDAKRQAELILKGITEGSLSRSERKFRLILLIITICASRE